MSLGRFKEVLVEDWAGASSAPDLDARFYGLTRNHIMKIVFPHAEINNVSNRLNKEKMAGNDWLEGLAKEITVSKDTIST